jgi:uncharacterized membrane protein
MEAFQSWVRENKGLFIGMCIGLLVAILFLTIGFWATLLIFVCVGIGAYFGSHPQARERISDWFTSLFKK